MHDFAIMHRVGVEGERQGMSNVPYSSVSLAVSCLMDLLIVTLDVA